MEDVTLDKELGEEGRRVVEDRFSDTGQAKAITQIYREFVSNQTLSERTRVKRLVQ